jgi:type IV pilus assembly protein PilB
MSESSSGIIALLVRTGALREEQVKHAERIQARLKPPRPLLSVLKQLGYVDDTAIDEAIASSPADLRLGEALVAKGLITAEELSRVLAQQATQTGRKLGALLLEADLVSEEQLLTTLSLLLGAPYVHAEFEVLDPAVVRSVPIEVGRTNRFVPLRRIEDKFLVAFADPLDEAARSAAADALGRDRIALALSGPRSIELTWAKVIAGRRTGNIAQVSDDQAVVAAVDGIIDAALGWDASDIHIEPMKDRLRIRFRCDGTMAHYRDLPIAIATTLTSRLKILAGADIAERRRHQGGRFMVRRGARELDLRASFYVTVHGEKTVLRLLNRERSFTPIDQVGMPGSMLRDFREGALDRPSGVILITGPTGSGKTSTLYACVNYLNDGSTAVITAEDPAEYVIDGVAQCSLNAELGVTYEESLRHIVRQDPDVIVIGEIRDTFSASAAIQAALTGHKVLSTFHTEDTIGGLVRLLNMEIEAFLISSTVVSVLAQRLLRRVCDNCAQPYEPTAADLRHLGYVAGGLDGARMRKGRGCSACRRSGYKGRVCVFELLVLGEEVREAILERRPSYEIRRISREKGLVSLLEDAVNKAAAGLTTVEEILGNIPRLDRPRPLPQLTAMMGEPK